MCVAAGCSERRSPVRLDESGPPIRGGTLELVGRSDVDHLASTSAYLSSALALSQTFSRQLLTYPPTGDYETKIRVVPDLASEVPTTENAGISPDGLTYTFHLRRDVLWDSRPPRAVTAHDLVRAFKLFCNPVSPVGAPGYYTDTLAGMAGYCGQFARVPGTVEAIRTFVTTHDLEGVSATNDFTIVFRLHAPAPDFLNIVAMPFASPVPVEYLEDLPDSPAFRQHTMSNGPYRIARYVQNREIFLERNPAWKSHTDPNRPAYVDRIHVRLGVDAQLQQLQIEAGTADLSFGDVVPTAELASLLAAPNPAVLLVPPESVYFDALFLVFNRLSQNGGGALGDVRVRQAIALAVDKAAAVQLFGGARVARALRQAVASGVAGFREGADRHLTPGDRGDPVAARRLLGDAGYPTGLSLRLVYANREANRMLVQALQASLSRAGIEIQLAQLTVADLYGRLLANPDNARRGEWDLALTEWVADWFGTNSGRSVIAPLFDGRNVGQNSQNYGGYQNLGVNALIDRATTAASAERAEQAWSDAAGRLMDDVALVPLLEIRVPYARSRRVRGCAWSVIGLNCSLSALWLADAAAGSGSAR
ncbi:MAG: ABC transporter substrate-binding protein [Acidobacteriota bacterium]